MKLELGVTDETTNAIQLLDEKGNIIAWVSGMDVYAQWTKEESLEHANLIIKCVNQFHNKVSCGEGI